MSSDGVLELLRRFNGLNGAVIISLSVNFGISEEDSEVICQTKVFCDDSGNENGWHQIFLHVRKRVMFSWVESSWDTNLVLNFPVRIIDWDGVQIIDFDPLHARQKHPGLTVSDWFIGGLEVSIGKERFTNK